MTLSYAGSLPVASVQLGLAAALPGLSAKVTGLQSIITDLEAALAGQLQMKASFPPNVPGLAAAATGHLNPASLTAMLNPATWVSGSAGLQADIGAKLGIAIAQREIAATLVASLKAGVSAGGIAGWGYSGTAQGFGTALEGEIQSGSAGMERRAQVSGLVIACENAASWESFSSGFNTGEPARQSIQPLGTLTGGEIVTGLATPLAEINAYLADLEGAVLSLEAQLQLSLGVDLPDPRALLEAGLSIDLDAAIDSLVTVSADLGAEVSAVLGNIDALISLQADIHATLSAGGLSLWTYRGELLSMGSELGTALQDGLPGGSGASAPVGGVAFACDSPSAWAAFGNLVPV